MYTMTKNAIIQGSVGQIVEIECAITPGLPSFSIIGLPDATVKESLERIRASLKHYKIALPAKRIVVNLSPAAIRKSGAHLDLGIAVTLLEHLNVVNIHSKETCSFVGELTLDGKILPLKGVLVIIEALKESGVKQLVLPIENYEEGTYIEGVQLIPVKNLKEVIEFLNEGLIRRIEVNDTSIDEPEKNYVDYKKILGQENGKRALTIALAGKHNLLLIGPPGTGKTMMLQNAPSLLPKMSREESIEVAKIYGVSGRDGFDYIKTQNRPFRSPHHSIGRGALVGGGNRPQPGEISLAHKGILFLDELGEFKNDHLEQLREPLENKKMSISRLGQRVTYPSDFILLAAMNPCKCGYYGSRIKDCSCSVASVKKSLSKFSKPLLDRIDMIYWVNDVCIEALTDLENNHSASTDALRTDVLVGWQRKKVLNEEGKEIPIDEEAMHQLTQGYKMLGLSPRTYNKVLSIAETIACVEGEDEINTAHILEALQYRKTEKIFRGE